MRGDLGTSLTYRTSALGVVLERFPATLELTLSAMLIAIVFAIPFGIVSALKRGTSVDGGIMTIAMFGQSIPSFWLGIMLILFVGLGLRWLPISGHVPILQPLFRGDIVQGARKYSSSRPLPLDARGDDFALFALAQR